VRLFWQFRVTARAPRASRSQREPDRQSKVASAPGVAVTRHCVSLLSQRTSHAPSQVRAQSAAPPHPQPETHAGSQSQPGGQQTAVAQVSPASHTRSQDPQEVGAARSASHPVAAIASQSARPAAHSTTSQLPEAQLSVASGRSQAVSQAPQ
jgi:hypothetical protein